MSASFKLAFWHYLTRLYHVQMQQQAEQKIAANKLVSMKTVYEVIDYTMQHKFVILKIYPVDCKLTVFGAHLVSFSTEPVHGSLCFAGTASGGQGLSASPADILLGSTQCPRTRGGGVTKERTQGREGE